MNFLKIIMTKFILKNFLKINLTSFEKEITDESINLKYLPSIKKSLFMGLLILPAIIFLDSTVIISVLIPITMVAGTAWFSISLANVKKKFESFGLELTTDVFESFTTSLIMLIFLTFVSLLSPFLEKFIEIGKNNYYVILISAILGIYVVFINIYKIFIGALKYDINDAMLAGQNEAAEKFFKKSLSFLQVTSKNLQDGKDLQVANYYIGLAFFEIFTYINSLKLKTTEKKVLKLIDDSNKLIFNPSMKQKEADTLSLNLISNFLDLIKNKSDEDILKSYNAICDELENLKKENNTENQKMIDTRLSVVFSEIANMIDNGGESLFRN